MEMTGHCIDCPLMVDRFDADACALQSQEANEAFESWDDMRRGCTLLPLPEGHGRLIDADAVAKMVLDSVNQEDAQGLMFTKIICKILKEALTIIEAEGEA